jgi:hypothetical protein
LTDSFDVLPTILNRLKCDFSPFRGFETTIFLIPPLRYGDIPYSQWRTDITKPRSSGQFGAVGRDMDCKATFPTKTIDHLPGDLAGIPCRDTDDFQCGGPILRTISPQSTIGVEVAEDNGHKSWDSEDLRDIKWTAWIQVLDHQTQMEGQDDETPSRETPDVPSTPAFSVPSSESSQFHSFHLIFSIQPCPSRIIGGSSNIALSTIIPSGL